jgi:hypothetical protein
MTIKDNYISNINGKSSNKIYLNNGKIIYPLTLNKIVNEVNEIVKLEDVANGIQYTMKEKVVAQVGVTLFAKLCLLFPTFQQTITDTQTQMEIGTGLRYMIIQGTKVEEVITPLENMACIGTTSSFFYPTMPVVSLTTRE